MQEIIKKKRNLTEEIVSPHMHVEALEESKTQKSIL